MWLGTQKLKIETLREEKQIYLFSTQTKKKNGIWTQPDQTCLLDLLDPKKPKTREKSKYFGTQARLLIPETDILYQTTSLCSTSTMTTTNGKAWELYTVTQVVDFYNIHKNPLGLSHLRNWVNCEPSVTLPHLPLRYRVKCVHWNLEIVNWSNPNT